MSAKEEGFRSGFATLIGRPNVGKSTLMNSLVGEKVAIVSNKPQTTRNKIQSILTRENYQMVFIDTPGLHVPKSKLGQFMVRSVESALNQVDIVLYLVEPSHKIHELDLDIIQRLSKVKSPVFLLINKIDTIEKEKVLTIIDQYKELYQFAEIIPISAMQGDNLSVLMDAIYEYLPLGPQYFPGDTLTDQPERQLVAELVREKALKLLQDEIPHGIAVETMNMKKRPDKDLIDIECNIYCEKDSHKGIIIGKKGAMLKEIGTRARHDMERLLGSPVHLQLWVKVKKDWRDSDFLLRNFGYHKKNL